MTKKPTLYSSQKASLFNKTSRLHSYQIKAPVHWGVNATLAVLRVMQLGLRPLCIGV